jgi:cation diffusion facilitator family transporter
MSGKLAITATQLQKERMVLWAIIADLLLVLAFVISGIFSGSMTVISEAGRGALLLSVELVSYIVLWKTHRDRFTEFEFGIGKIERIVNIMVAFGLLFTCVFILDKIFSVGDTTPMSTSNLVMAVIAADINFLINLYFTIALMKVNREESSVIISSQIKSRLAKLIASAIVLGVLLLALWLPDPKAARSIDILGSMFVLCYMAVIAFGLMRESLPEILDRTVPEPEHYQILRALSKNFDQYDGFGGYQTRRSGKDLFIQLNLSFRPETPLAQIEERLSPIRKEFASELPGSKVVIVPELLEI